MPKFRLTQKSSAAWMHSPSRPPMAAAKALGVAAFPVAGRPTAFGARAQRALATREANWHGRFVSQ